MSISDSTSSSLPSNILTTSQYQAQQAATQTAQSTSMGQGAFLTLFTTQLKNQDPTDPVKNSDFVAQLAQFSQLEATTSMQQSLQSMVTTMNNNGLMNASALIGKSVGVDGGSVNVSSGSVSQASINLPTGADGVTLNIYDSTGSLVNTEVFGAQSAGQLSLPWNATDSTGKTVPDGSYTYSVSVVSNGVTTNPTVTTQQTVVGVTSGANGATTLNLGNGQSIGLSNVSTISQ
jgi:flagellar basal-body rod modification protein FlgD